MTKELVRTPQICENKNGGHFAKGRAYGIEKKVKAEVAHLLNTKGPDLFAFEKLRLRQIGKECKVGLAQALCDASVFLAVGRIHVIVDFRGWYKPVSMIHVGAAPLL